MKLNKLYRESEEKFDYTKILFPNKNYSEDVVPEIIDADGTEYVMSSDAFDILNESWIGPMGGVNFVFEVEVQGQWYGKYWPGTRYEPPEYPEYEIDDVVSDVVRIELYDKDGNVVDITNRFPSKEQAEKDGNGKWYEEYSKFISILGEYAEEDACERVHENPPEPDEPDYDDRDDYDDSERYYVYRESRMFNEDSVPKELRDKALSAMRVLRNNASMSDSELQGFIKRAIAMHRDELVNAARDLLEYRAAAKGLTDDRQDTRFVGSTADFLESSDDNDDFTIPDSEWKKVVGYIEKGSNFKQVGAMCRKNEMKMKSRYLILKALYQDDLAREFADAANMDSQLISKLDQQIPEVPSKYSSLVKGVDANDVGEQETPEPTPEPEKQKVNISDVLKDIVADRNPILTISGDWHTFSGRIGNYNVDINGKKGDKAIRLVDKAEYKYPDIIIEYYFPGTYGWSGNWIESSTEYSIGDWDRVRKYAYNPGEGTMKVYKMPKLTKSQQELLNQAKGVVNESVDYDDEEEEEDGWNRDYLYDSGVFGVLDEIRDAEYEMRHCVRGCNTGCTTYKELGEYIVSLGERLASSGEDIKYID